MYKDSEKQTGFETIDLIFCLAFKLSRKVLLFDFKYFIILN